MKDIQEIERKFLLRYEITYDPAFQNYNIAMGQG